MMDLKIEHSLVNWVRFFNPVFYYYVFKINFPKFCNNNFIFIFLFLGLEIWKENIITRFGERNLTAQLLEIVHQNRNSAFEKETLLIVGGVAQSFIEMQGQNIY